MRAETGAPGKCTAENALGMKKAGNACFFHPR